MLALSPYCFGHSLGHHRETQKILAEWVNPQGLQAGVSVTRRSLRGCGGGC